MPPVTSLEVSKRMKELGFKQESHFYWFHSIKSSFQIFTKKEVEKIVEREKFIPNDFQTFSAYLSDEIAEMLPDKLDPPPGYGVDAGMLEIFKDKKLGWFCKYIGICSYTEKTLPDVLARMAIYLKEQGII